MEKGRKGNWRRKLGVVDGRGEGKIRASLELREELSSSFLFPRAVRGDFVVRKSFNISLLPAISNQQSALSFSYNPAILVYLITPDYLVLKANTVV